MVADCPDSWDNTGKVSVVAAKEPQEKIVLFTGNNNKYTSQLCA